MSSFRRYRYPLRYRAGLIDLHNHLAWIVFPRWHPAQEFTNRYDWQQKPTYQNVSYHGNFNSCRPGWGG
jgi:hypothetical protein